MRKQTMCIGENKGADQLRGKLISAFVFATRIVQFLFFLNFMPVTAQAGLCQTCSKPHCWFSDEKAPFLPMSEMIRTPT